MLFRVSTLLLPLALCSCATTYAPPTIGDTASLSIVNATSGIAHAAAFKNAKDCSGGKQALTASGLTPHGRQSLTVSAGADFSFVVTTPDSYGGGAFTSCFVPLTFTPKSGATYRAVFRLNEANTACQVQLSIVNGDLEEPESSVRLRTWRTPFSENGSFCQADS